MRFKRAAIAGLLAFAMPAGARDKLPDDAPTCAAPGTRLLFVSPMGEPFRAAAGGAFPSAAWFAAADRDHDGAIDRTELIADADRFFRTLDGDHDGRLTPEEVTAYERDIAPEIALFGPRWREQAQEERPRRAPRAGEGDYGGPLGAGRYAWLNIPEPVSSADADIDRAVSAREFAQSAGRRFEALDPAGRGRLTLAALPKTPAQQAIEGPCRPPRAIGKAQRARLRDHEPVTPRQ